MTTKSDECCGTCERWIQLLSTRPPCNAQMIPVDLAALFVMFLLKLFWMLRTMKRRMLRMMISLLTTWMCWGWSSPCAPSWWGSSGVAGWLSTAPASHLPTPSTMMTPSRSWAASCCQSLPWSCPTCRTQCQWLSHSLDKSRKTSKLFCFAIYYVIPCNICLKFNIFINMASTNHYQNQSDYFKCVYVL